MILIKNVKIIDGTGRPAFPGDVLISGDKISAIGSFPSRKAEVVIEGLGSYLAPGFIDINSQIDHDLTLFTNPNQKQLTDQGITTAIGGHGGSSLTPLLYGSLKSIQKWTDINQVNVNWQSFAEFVQVVKKLPLGVNFGSLVGHSTIRRDILGEYLTDLTDNEIKVFKNLLEQSLKEGAFGLSTGLNFVHARQAPQMEIKELVSVVAKNNGLYATHLRNEKEGIVEAVTEIIDIYKATSAKTIVSRFLPFLKMENQFELAYDLLRQGGDGLFFVVHLNDADLVPLYTLLPIWAQKGNLQEMLAVIANPANEKRVLAELPKLKDDCFIAKAREYNYLTGKTIKEFSENRELGANRGLLELMKITQLKAVVGLKNINCDLALQTLDDNKCFVAQPFSNYLAIADKKRWPIEKTIAKITGLPAQILNLKNRGLIKENYFADLVLIHDNAAQKVIVNGQVADDKKADRQQASLAQKAGGQFLTLTG